MGEYTSKAMEGDPQLSKEDVASLKGNDILINTFDTMRKVQNNPLKKEDEEEEEISRTTRGSAIPEKAFMDRIKNPNSVRHITSHLLTEEGSVLVNSTEEKEIYGIQGLAQYIVLCWAEERGVVLRPDMFWFTICSEFARDVIARSKEYQGMFTSKPGDKKESLLIETTGSENISLEKLVAKLQDVVPSDDMVEVIINTTFPSQVNGYREATISSLLHAATPFYDYMTYMCGIPNVSIVGRKEEWESLVKSCHRLSTTLTPCSAFRKYLESVSGLMAVFIKHAFCDRSDTTAVDLAKKFFSEIFWIEENCESGHPHYCKGWISNMFYMKGGENSVPSTPYEFINVLDFPTHMGLVPWQNLETQRMFCKGTGLLFAVPDQKDPSYLVPMYGELKYEILDQGSFDVVAKNGAEDRQIDKIMAGSAGKKYAP